MERAVLISIRPRWVAKIMSGEKTIELRKTKPKVSPPFKCYIYQTLPKWGDWNERDGRVVGEFVCDEIYKDTIGQYADIYASQGLVSLEEQVEYALNGALYGWHISGLKMYDNPKPLNSFCNGSSRLEIKDGGVLGWSGMQRPPQSWCYVEEISDSDRG